VEKNMIADKSILKNLQVSNLHKRFRVQQGEVIALSDINLSISKGEFVSIVGSSGCGKSTLLRINRRAGARLPRGGSLGSGADQRARSRPRCGVSGAPALAFFNSTSCASYPSETKQKLKHKMATSVWKHTSANGAHFML